MFRNPKFSKLEFKGDLRVLLTCVISALEAKRLLHKDYKAYLACVIDTSTPKMTLESVPIVRGFSYVFPKNLPRLPPDKELEFGINFVPRSAPISIPPLSDPKSGM